MRKTTERLAFYVILIGAWAALARSGFWPDYLFPSPRMVVRALSEGVANKSFLIGVAVSLKRIVVGYGISVVGGVLIGLLLGRSERAENTLGSLILGLQTLPSICWMPAALLWFGLSEWAIIFVVVLGAVFSIAIATHDGIKNLPPRYIQAAQNMGSRGWHLYLDVILPGALPSIAQGLKQGWSFAWRSLMGAELIFISLGLGHLLQMGRELNDMAQVAAVMVVITVLGLAADRLVFSRFENSIRVRWGLARS